MKLKGKPRQYSSCIKCSKPRRKNGQSPLCRGCYLFEVRKDRKTIVSCFICGKVKQASSCKRCADCYHRSKRETLEERIPRFIRKQENGCWIWTGTKAKGYGKIIFRGKTLLVHRYLWENQFGPIKNNLFACHKCDVKSCVNPSHIFIGTNSDNIKDAIRKGIKIGKMK